MDTTLYIGHYPLVPSIKDFEPLIGRWRQVVDAPRHVEEKVAGDMTLEWLRGEKVILQRSIAENPMFPEGVVVIMARRRSRRGRLHGALLRLPRGLAHAPDELPGRRLEVVAPRDQSGRLRSALRRHALRRRKDDRKLVLSRRRRRVDPRLRRHLHTGLVTVRPSGAPVSAPLTRARAAISTMRA